MKALLLPLLVCTALAQAQTPFTSCSSTVTLTCQPGNVTSSATVHAVPAGGPVDPPVTPPPSDGTFNTVPTACLNVTSIGVWQKISRTNWLPNLPATTVDSTDYRNIYSPPGTGQQTWPSSSSGSKPVVAIAAQAFVAMGFTVPGGASGGVRYFNVNSISQPVSITLSECPGDFGQQGTHISNTYCKSNRSGSTNGGVQTWVGGALGTCTIQSGSTYWLNFIAADLPPAGSTTPPTTTCTGSSCTAQVQLTH